MRLVLAIAALTVVGATIVHAQDARSVPKGVVVNGVFVERIVPTRKEVYQEIMNDWRKKQKAECHGRVDTVWCKHLSQY